MTTNTRNQDLTSTGMPMFPRERWEGELHVCPDQNEQLVNELTVIRLASGMLLERENDPKKRKLLYQIDAATLRAAGERE
jgi:hypothetical protein